MDRGRIQAFLDRFVEHASGATTIALLAVADRSGLLEQLAGSGPVTSDELATTAGLDERYVREILSGLAAAGIVEYSPDAGAFALPPEHALFLTDETSPYFMGGWFDMIPAAMTQIDGIARAVVHGGGVGFEEYGPRMIRGIDRANSPPQNAFLVKRWLPAVPGLVERLESGIRVADVGCGSGTAVTLIAEAFPNTSVTGYDVSEDSIAVARSRLDGQSNAEFLVYGASEIPIDPPYDLITTFDVIHDLSDPLRGMRRIRDALSQGGCYLMAEPNASSHLEQNLSPRGALLYGVSTLHCMTQSLAVGGAGLGSVWGREKTEELAREAGFGGFSRLDDITNRFTAFYLLTP